MNAHRTRRRYGTSGNTNEDLVTGARDIYIDSDSRQKELPPELVYQFITSAHTQNFIEGRNFGHDYKIGVHRTSLVDNDVFRKRLLFVSNDQRIPHDSLSLSLYFCRKSGIPFIVQQFPAWQLQPQTLVAWKMLAALEVSQNFMVTMSQNRNVLTTNTAIKLAGLCCNISGPSNKKLTNIAWHYAFFTL